MRDEIKSDYRRSKDESDKYRRPTASALGAIMVIECIIWDVEESVEKGIIQSCPLTKYDIRSMQRNKRNKTHLFC